jgi:hypothetical protein
MASNLVADTCIGQHSLCIMRVAALAADCAPAGGADSGIVSLGLITATATAEIKEGRRLEPTNGCGRAGWQYVEPDATTGYTITGEGLYHDLEMKYLMFGGTLANGKGGGAFAGKTIAYAEPHYTDAQTNGFYLEMIVRNAGEGVGECAVGGEELPYATGYIFGKCRARAGDINFSDQMIPFTFSINAESNPALYDGPWNDYPAVGYIPNSPKVEAQYSQAEYEAIFATARCGFQTLPAGS